MGLVSPRTLTLIAIVIAAAISFVWRELTVSDPLFDLRLFRNTAFAAAQTVVTFASIGFFATTFLLTFYLQGALAQSPLTTGLLMIPLSAPQLIASPLGGRLADRVGSGWPMLTAMIILGLCALWLSRLPTALSLWSIAGPLAFMAIANGFYWPPLASMVMKISPRNRLGAASGLFFTFRNVGFSLSLTLALVFAETSLPGAVAMQVFLGIHTTAAVGLAHALIHAVRSAFRWFIISFAIAFLAIIPIIRHGKAPTPGS